MQCLSPWRHGDPYIYIYISMNSLLNLDGLVQERRNSSASAMELCLSCTNPSIYCGLSTWHQSVPTASTKHSYWLPHCLNDPGMMLQKTKPMQAWHMQQKGSITSVILWPFVDPIQIQLLTCAIFNSLDIWQRKNDFQSSCVMDSFWCTDSLLTWHLSYVCCN